MSNIQVVAIDGKIVMSVDEFKAINRQIRAEAVDEFVKKAIKKQEALFINPSVSEQMQFKCFLYVIAEQVKEQSNE